MRRSRRARLRRGGVSAAVSGALLLGAALVPGTSGAFTASVTNSGVSAKVSSYYRCSEFFAARSSNVYLEYKLDGSTADVTDSGTGATVNNGTISGTVLKDDTADQPCPGEAGKGLQFDGSATAVTTFGPNGTAAAPQSTSFSGTQSFTVELWFKTPANAPGGRLIGFGNKQDNSSFQYDKILYIGQSGKLLFGTNGSAAYATLTTVAKVNDGKWHHVAVAMANASGTTLYVDGTLVQSNTAKTTQSYSGWWRIGAGPINSANWPDAPANGGSGGWFKGSMRYVAVYKTALSKSEVESDCAAGWSVATGVCGAFPTS